MSYFYVLTYLGEKPEYWFRRRLVDIIECIHDFMKYDASDEGLNFTISIEKFDTKESVCLDDALGFDKIQKDTNHKQLKKLARTRYKLPAIEHDYKCTQKTPNKIMVCKDCGIFTEKANCVVCNKETLNTDI